MRAAAQTGRRVFLSMTQYTIRKMDHLGKKPSFVYSGEALSQDEHAVVMLAPWTMKTLVGEKFTIEPGDPFIETFYFDRWYNVMEIRGKNGALHEWYANVTRPTRLHDGVLDWDDLKLDVEMTPAGDWKILDEDEFAEVEHELSADERVSARDAIRQIVQDLQTRWRAYANDQLAAKLTAKGWTLGTAESCTGGLIGDEITNRAGSSAYFMGGVMSYDNRIKRDVLGVREETLQTAGAVSELCALEMARGARRLLGVDVAVSATGIAGPGGGTDDKPVGLVYLGISTPEMEKVEKHIWTRDRIGNKRATADAALKLLVAGC